MPLSLSSRNRPTLTRGSECKMNAQIGATRSPAKTLLSDLLSRDPRHSRRDTARSPITAGTARSTLTRKKWPGGKWAGSVQVQVVSPPDVKVDAAFRSETLHQILHQTSSPGVASGATDTRLPAPSPAFPRRLSPQTPLGATTRGHSKSAARKGLRVQVSSPAHAKLFTKLANCSDRSATK